MNHAPFLTASAIHSAKDCQESRSRLFRRMRGYLRLYADLRISPRLRSKFDASDIVQITLAEADQAFEGFAGDQRLLRAWMLKILTRNLIDAKRSYTNSQKRDVNREQAFPKALCSVQPTASSVLIEREERDQMRAAISKLPKRTRQMIELRHRDGLGFNEIGERLDMASTAVRKLWSRTLSDLQKQFAQS